MRDNFATPDSLGGNTFMDIRGQMPICNAKRPQPPLRRMRSVGIYAVNYVGRVVTRFIS